MDSLRQDGAKPFAALKSNYEILKAVSWQAGSRQREPRTEQRALGCLWDKFKL